jgi:NAD(P)-dependent dehydrogenase (short-subunit alcohol dehydrogenase family)
MMKGHNVILACRDTHKAQTAAHNLQQQLDTSRPHGSSSSNGGQQRQDTPTRVTTVKCDLSSFESVRECAADVAARWPELDVLVCNAAVIPRAHRRTRDGIDEQLQVNHLSHFLLVDQLLPCLLRSAEQRAAAAGGTSAGLSQQNAGSSSSSSSSSGSSRIVVVGSGQHTQVPPEFQDPAQLRMLLPGSDEECPLPPMQL